MTRELRKESIVISLTVTEKLEIKCAADRLGYSVAEWVRLMTLPHATRSNLAALFKAQADEIRDGSASGEVGAQT